MTTNKATEEILKLRRLVVSLKDEIEQGKKLQYLLKDISDKEKKRISNDFHDNLGQTFS